MLELWLMLFVFADGTASWAPVERVVCEQAVAMLDRGEPVSIELGNGQRVAVENAVCVPPDEESEGGPVVDGPLS